MRRLRERREMPARELHPGEIGPVPSGPDLPSLTVAVSTRGARALGLDAAAWPAAPGLDFLVLVQEPDATRGSRPALARARGAARRDRRAPRHHRARAQPQRRARRAPGARSCFVADDDVVHPPGAYAGIRRFFAENPGLDLFVGRSLDPDGRPRKRPLPRRRG